MEPIRDAEVGGSNPLAPTTIKHRLPFEAADLIQPPRTRGFEPPTATSRPPGPEESRQDTDCRFDSGHVSNSAFGGLGAVPTRSTNRTSPREMVSVQALGNRTLTRLRSRRRRRGALRGGVAYSIGGSGAVPTTLAAAPSSGVPPVQENRTPSYPSKSTDSGTG